MITNKELNEINSKLENKLIELEKKYTEMTQSFDIQDADTKNTLVLLCKTDLKMNQAIDAGDIEGFQKLSKVSEGLRKSAKFTAAQNKETKEKYGEKILELMQLERKESFIYGYKLSNKLIIDSLK